MATPDKTAETPDTVAPPTKGKLAGMVAGPLLVGALLGGFVIAPKMRDDGNNGAAAAAEEAPSEHGEGKGGGLEPKMVRLDNVIVNPAGTQGQRFLIVSVAVEVSSAEVETKLRHAEVAFRDAVTTILERKTMDVLTMAGARDSLRREITETARRLSGDRKVKVFIPQFLIQ